MSSKVNNFPPQLIHSSALWCDYLVEIEIVTPSAHLSTLASQRKSQTFGYCIQTVAVHDAVQIPELHLTVIIV